MIDLSELDREGRPVTKEEAIELVTARSYDRGQDCPHCGGEGTIPSGTMSIHTRRGGFGADNLLEGVIEEINKSEEPIVVGRGVLSDFVMKIVLSDREVVVEI